MRDAGQRPEDLPQLCRAGELYQTCGDFPYPEERVYSDYGELSKLHTFWESCWTIQLTKQVKDVGDFRSGCLRYGEWKGFWKAHSNDSIMTAGEWDQARASLRLWLSSRYLVQYSNEFPPGRWQRHCWVEGDYADPERTLTITIAVAQVLSVPFLKFVQSWLLRDARAWRVAVPIDNTDENLVLIYPEAVRINEAAEADLHAFVEQARPLLHRTIHEGPWGFKFFHLKTKPYPPLPTDEK